MQISSNKHKNFLVNSEEDGVTEIIITNNKNDAGKSPRGFVTRPKSLESNFFYKLRIMKNLSMMQ